MSKEFTLSFVRDDIWVISAEEWAGGGVGVKHLFSGTLEAAIAELKRLCDTPSE